MEEAGKGRGGGGGERRGRTGGGGRSPLSRLRPTRLEVVCFALDSFDSGGLAVLRDRTILIALRK